MVFRKVKNSSSARQKSPPVKLQLIRQFDETFDGNSEGEELAKDQTVRLKEGPTNDEQKGEEREEDKEDGHVDEGNEDDEEASEDDEDEGDPDDETTDPGGKGVNKNDKTEGGDDGKDKDRAEQEVTKQLRERQPATSRVKPSASKLDKVKATSVVKRPIAKIVAVTRAEPAILQPRVATTANIVFAAIASSTDKKGVSLIGIKKHFMNHYPEKDWNKSRVRVKTAISRALEEGSIVRTKPSGKAQGAQGMFKVKKVKTLPELPNSVKVVKKNPSTSKASSKTAVKKSSKAKSLNDKENVKLSRKKPSKKNEESEVEALGKHKRPAKRGAPVGRRIKGSPDPSSE